MKTRKFVKKGCCFQVSVPHASGPVACAISETQSSYTLYESVECPDIDKGREQWENLETGQECPAGWKQCSDEIPSDTQHKVFDIVNDTIFHLKGCTDEIVYLRF